MLIVYLKFSNITLSVDLNETVDTGPIYYIYNLAWLSVRPSVRRMHGIFYNI